MVMILAAAGSAEVPAFLVLESKGFQVDRQFDNASNTESWVASDGQLTLHGSGPLELLGLLSLYETRGNGWHASDGDIDRFLHRFGYE